MAPDFILRRLTTTLILLGFIALAFAATPSASAEEENPPCNGIWMASEDVGPVTVTTNLQANCTWVDVYLPATEVCVREGAYYPMKTVGPVTFWEYRCGNPETRS